MSLDKIRRSKRLTQEDVARHIGVKRNTISMWETGKAFPKSRDLIKIAELYGCSVEDLLGNTA